MALFKGRAQFVKSFRTVEVSVALGFRVWKDEVFSLRGINNWELSDKLAQDATRALINLVSGKKKKTVYVELRDDPDQFGMHEVDLYVPGLIYGEFTITVQGEKCLHINAVLSWLYDYEFKHAMVLDILNANKRKRSEET